MNLGKKIAYNTIVQLVGRLISLLLMLVTINYISNHLVIDGSALTGYGQYTIVFTYASLIGAAADFGLFSLLVRDIAGKSKKEIEEYIGSALGFRILLMGVALLLVFLFYPLLPYGSDVKVGIILSVFVAFSLLFSQTIASVLQVNLMSNRIVIAETVGRFFVMILTISVLQQGMGLLGVVGAHVIGYSISIILSYWLVLPLARIPIRFNTKIWRETLPQFLPIAFVTLLSLTHSRIDAVMLSFYKPEAEVGLYGIAYKVFDIAVVIPSIFASNLLPVISKLHLEGRRDDFARVLRRSSSILFLLATVIILVVFMLSPYIVVFISQLDFLAAALPLRILILSMLFIFVGGLLIQAIIAAHAQKRLILSYGISVFLNIIINFYAIPHYSFVGAAVTTLITEFVLALIITMIAYKHLVFSLDVKMILRLLGTLVISGFVIWSIQSSYLTSITQFADMTKIFQLLVLTAAAVPILAVYGAVFWALNGGKMPKLQSLLKI